MDSPRLPDQRDEPRLASGPSLDPPATRPVTQNTALIPFDTSPPDAIPRFHIRNPSTSLPESALPLTGPGLALHADLSTSAAPSQPEPSAMEEPPATTPSIPVTRPGFKSSLSAASMATNTSLSPGSAISSPALAAMTDITPLPSPLMPGESPGPWRRAMAERPGSSGSLSSVREETRPKDIPDYPSLARASSTKKKKKGYASLMPTAVEARSGKTQADRNEANHARHRSLSEFAPEPMHNVRPRNVTLSGSEAATPSGAPPVSQLHREEYLAEQRGMVLPHPVSGSSVLLPTPPPSNRSVTESEGEEKLPEEDIFVEYLTVRSGKRKLQYRPVRPLGQGTFSKVVLATSEPLRAKVILNETSESSLDPKYLVAIKIVEHGPAGGADEERVELSLKREIELLRSISHPSIIHLKAFDLNATEALLVLTYCPGGDLFELASQRRALLTASIVQRIFAELVSAVSYLHSNLIVHRDIKLENVLLNLPPHHLPTLASPDAAAHYPHPLVTLGDLGLSRRIPPPPASPLLSTRCGSEDYAAPEILLSQPYDGRATDAWALGVLLYALMEGRLPFDAPPAHKGGGRGRSRAAHRIARCDWMWCQFGDDEGEWDEQLGKGWNGARECVEGLLRKVSRGRLSVRQLSKMEYVRDGIKVEGGLRRLHGDWEEEDEEGGEVQSSPFQRPSLNRADTFADLEKMDEAGDGEEVQAQPER